MAKRRGFIYWTPRILAIIFILFLALFSLDVFDSSNGYNLVQTILALFMHNIPAIVLTILLVISWKYELVGAITFFIAGIAYLVLLLTSQNFQWFMLSWSLIIALPAILIGILFLLNWRRKRNI
jgi:hypothetical protein